MQISEYTELFRTECEEAGIFLNEEQIIQFQKYYELLTDWNTRMNLTSITEYGQVLKKHFEDSLMLIKAYPVGQVYSLVDVGTGAGFPGIPLKIAFPDIKVLLLDSLGKRVTFLNQVIAELGLTEIEALHSRAEDAAKVITYREQFDLAVSRAVANLASLSEYCLPFVRKGGYFIPYKSGKVDAELESAKEAIGILGGKIEEVVRFQLQDWPREGAVPEIMERSLIRIRKEKMTPRKYPRKAGLPVKEPLG